MSTIPTNKAKHRGFKEDIFTFEVPQKIFKIKPGLVGMLLGQTDKFIEIADPEIAKGILQQFQRGIFGSLRLIVGETIFNTDNFEFWKADKKALSHSFANRTLAVELYPHITYVLQRAATVLKNRNPSPIDIDDFAQRITFDIIGLMVYGKDWDCLHNSPVGDKMLITVGENFKGNSKVIRNPFWLLNPFFLWSAFTRRNWFRAQSKSIVLERLRNPNEGKKDILQYVIEARRGRTDMDKVVWEVLGDVGTFLSAGFETTAHTIAFTIYFLAKYPEAQQKLYEEIKNSKTGQEGSLIPGHDEVQQLQYLNAVIHESQRLIPVAIVTSRLTDKDSQYGEYFIPKGTTCAISIVKMLHNPEIFPEPHLFKPERWITNPHPPGFYPFGAGSRACIGQNMARVELGTVIFFLISMYQWRLQPGFELAVEHAITTKPKSGLWCTYHPR